MSSNQSIKNEIFIKIHELLNSKPIEVNDDLPLIGGESALDSMRLVELCLWLEDKGSEIGFEFDWTSEVAMSRSRSMFRTAGSLVSEFIKQMEQRQ